MKKITKDMTAEETVTKLLSSNEIIQQREKNTFISNPIIDTLGDFLPVITPEIPPPDFTSEEFSKYVFIRV